jgi:hypothetical protein
MKAALIGIIVGLVIVLGTCLFVCNPSMPAYEKGTVIEAVIEFVGAVLEGLEDD